MYPPLEFVARLQSTTTTCCSEPRFQILLPNKTQPSAASPPYKNYINTGVLCDRRLLRIAKRLCMLRLDGQFRAVASSLTHLSYPIRIQRLLLAYHSHLSLDGFSILRLLWWRQSWVWVLSLMAFTFPVRAGHCVFAHIFALFCARWTKEGTQLSS
jgi:hypothetical protein